MAKYDFDDEDGVWRTVGGRRIFIREGQSLGDAMKSSGKFKSAKKKDGKYETVKKDELLEKDTRTQKELIEDRKKFEEKMAENYNDKEAKEFDEKYQKRMHELAKEDDDKKYGDKKITNDEEYENTISALNYIAKQYNQSNSQEEKETLERVMKNYQKNLNEYNNKLKEKYMNIPERERAQAYADGKNWKDLVREKESSGGSDKPQSEKYLERADREIKETKKVIEGHVAEEREKLKGYIRDNYKNPDDYLKDYDRENAESRIGTRRDKFDKDDKSDYFSEQHKMEKNDRDDVVKMIQEIKDEDRENDRIIAEYERKNSGSKADKVAERLGLKKGDSYVNKEGTKVDILEKDDKGQTLHKFTTSDGKTDYKNYNEKDVESMLKHNGYEKQNSNGSEISKGTVPKKSTLNTMVEKNSEIAEKIIDDDEWNDIRVARYGNGHAVIENERTGQKIKITPSDTKESLNKKIQDSYKETSNQAYKKAFEDYKKKHPNTKLTLNKFIDMSEGK